MLHRPRGRARREAHRRVWAKCGQGRHAGHGRGRDLRVVPGDTTHRPRTASRVRVPPGAPRNRPVTDARSTRSTLVPRSMSATGAPAHSRDEPGQCSLPDPPGDGGVRSGLPRCARSTTTRITAAATSPMTNSATVTRTMNMNTGRSCHPARTARAAGAGVGPGITARGRRPSGRARAPRGSRPPSPACPRDRSWS